MSSTMASNAILAKARAMYGKSLSETDYKQLIDCRNVPEVAAYLKTRTCYSSVLTGLNESEVHRGQLEPMLRQDIYFDVFALSRYAKDKRLVFIDFIISGMEIEQIIRCITLLKTAGRKTRPFSSIFASILPVNLMCVYLLLMNLGTNIQFSPQFPTAFLIYFCRRH